MSIEHKNSDAEQSTNAKRKRAWMRAERARMWAKRTHALVKRAKNVNELITVRVKKKRMFFRVLHTLACISHARLWYSYIPYTPVSKLQPNRTISTISGQRFERQRHAAFVLHACLQLIWTARRVSFCRARTTVSFVWFFLTSDNMKAL